MWRKMTTAELQAWINGYISDKYVRESQGSTYIWEPIL